MKNIFSILFLSLCVAFASCTEDYDADAATSYYEAPTDCRLVKSVKSTFTENGYESTYEHRFAYDAKNRIKTITSTQTFYSPFLEKYIDTVYYKCNMTSTANYFYRGEELEVAYAITIKYPDKPTENKYASSSNYGFFKPNGVLGRFSLGAFEYNLVALEAAYSDDDICIELYRDGKGNVTGYKKYKHTTGQVLENKGNRYFYSSAKKNRTNFDFSAYFGYWGAEQAVPLISRAYRAPFQLAAFGMLGATSTYLPDGIIDADGGKKYGTWEWDEADNNYPVSYIDPEERKTEITYYN